MANAMLETAPEQRFLVRQSMAPMDRHYGEELGLLRNSEDGKLAGHSMRGSAHYAVGLLCRSRRKAHPARSP